MTTLSQKSANKVIPNGNLKKETNITDRNHPHSERQPKKQNQKQTARPQSRSKIKKLSTIRKLHSGVLRGTVWGTTAAYGENKRGLY